MATGEDLVYRGITFLMMAVAYSFLGIKQRKNSGKENFSYLLSYRLVNFNYIGEVERAKKAPINIFRFCSVGRCSLPRC